MLKVLRRKAWKDLALNEDERIEYLSYFELGEKIENKEIDNFVQFIEKSFSSDRGAGTQLNFIGNPEKKLKYLLPFGWISPDGKWYSCHFGGHEYKSMIIICNNNILTKRYLDKYDDENIGIENLLDMGNGLIKPSDFLMDLGWCRFQSKNMDQTPIPIVGEYKRLTKVQIDIVYDIVNEFNYEVDPLKGLDI